MSWYLFAALVTVFYSFAVLTDKFLIEKRIKDPFGFYLRFVERYNWIDTRNPAGIPKPEFIKEAELYKDLMEKGHNE